MKRKILFGSLAAAALLGAAPSARADHYFAARTPLGTYNVYQAITTDRTWDEARVDANSRTWNGTPGHLATISSLVENFNVFVSAGNRDWLIGLTDSDATSSLDGRVFPGPERGAARDLWQWENGEPYADIGAWGGGEPNDWPSHTPPGEDAAHLRGGDGLWNDHQVGSSLGQGDFRTHYIVEYDTGLASNPFSEWRQRTYQSNFSVNPGPDITNYATADALINGVGLAPGYPFFSNIFASDTTDPFTNPSPQANQAFDEPVPGLNPTVDNDDFVFVGTGDLAVNTAGSYTFRTNTDDGSRLRISVNGGAVEQVITDDILSGPHNVTSTPIALNAGDVVTFEWMWFERGGGAEGELDYSADGATFYLIGDNTGGLDNPTGINTATYVSDPGTAVTGPQLNTMADALSIINPAHLRGEAFTNTFNNLNEGGDGVYANGGQAPGLSGVAEDFVVVGDGLLEVLQEGDYKFASLSDDGARLMIDGVVVINDDSLHGANPAVDTKYSDIVHLTPGLHPIEFFYFERGGGASGELFLVDPLTNAPIALVGDVLNGGLRVMQVPEPSTLALSGLGLFGLALTWVRKRFKK